MKINPIIYLFSILVLLIISALVLPTRITSGKPGPDEKLAGNRKPAGRTRTMSRSIGQQRSSRSDAGESAETATQIAQLVLPNLKRSVSAAESGAASGSTQASIFAPQEQSLGTPQLVSLVGPVSQDQDLRTLPYIPPSSEDDELRLTRHPPSPTQSSAQSDPVQAIRQPALAVAMPTPSLTFGGITSITSACGCLPPDTDGDVGPNHYVQAVNSSFQIFDKSGTSLAGPTTYNSFFSALGAGTPCGVNQNRGDPIAFYDHMADRWVISDFAFTSFPGTSFYQCVGVSKTSDPVAGGWWLYAMQVDPANPTFLGDYPKFGLWPDAYYLSVNMFSNNTTFTGVRVYALPRTAMINGTSAPNPGAVTFGLTPATLVDSYSLVPATFRSGSPPPAGQPEYFMAINSSATSGTVETQVFAWRFHVDFATPANSTFGVGATHAPDATITVNAFVDAFTAAGSNIVPQTGTVRLLDTLGDKLMNPLAYQNLGGTESLYVSHTINNNQGGTGPTAIRWYQFNVTGNVIPAIPAQQQTFNNGADGLWRWMPSLAVDGQGDLVIGYTESSSTTDPAIAYAGRLAADPLNTLAQGEALLIQGAGHQTSASGRWGDYSATSVDPSDNCTFWHTNEYYSVTSPSSWNTRIGKFSFPGCSAPTAAPAAISGRIVTAAGAPLAGVTVRLSGAGSDAAITDSNGYYHFSGVDTNNFYTVTPSLVNYHFSPANRSFSLLADKTDAVFTASADAAVLANAIDTSEYFVRQHYLDFLGREPDHVGFNYWSNQVNQCNDDADCIRTRRIDVSAAFFMSREFQDTGSFVYKLYRGALGRQLSYAEFSADRSQVVGGPNLDASKAGLADAFVQRTEFTQRYQSAVTAEAFVDALLQTLRDSAGVDLSSERSNLIGKYNAGQTMNESRSLAVRALADNAAFSSTVYNQSFVLMEYFAYLRRNPDPAGYNFWLNVLNGDPGNYRGMVCSFITSTEYQRRFSSVVTRSNTECGR